MRWWCDDHGPRKPRQDCKQCADLARVRVRRGRIKRKPLGDYHHAVRTAARTVGNPALRADLAELGEMLRPRTLPQGRSPLAPPRETE